MSLHTQLLQATGVVSAVADALPAGWQRIVDQGLSLTILCGVAWVLWKRLKDLEERLNKYVEEDRKVMQDIIQKNTQAFENVNAHLDKVQLQSKTYGQ